MKKMRCRHQKDSQTKRGVVSAEIQIKRDTRQARGGDASTRTTIRGASTEPPLTARAISAVIHNKKEKKKKKIKEKKRETRYS